MAEKIKETETKKVTKAEDITTGPEIQESEETHVLAESDIQAIRQEAYQLGLTKGYEFGYSRGVEAGIFKGQDLAIINPLKDQQ